MGALTYGDVILPTVSGTLSILQAAAKEPSVKRVVFTSSVAAGGVNRADGPTQHFDGLSWNTETTATPKKLIPSSFTSSAKSWLSALHGTS